MPARQDARGCLTDAGLRAIEEAPLGGAPDELSRHLASCVPCQERVLSRAAGAAPGRGAAKRPPAWRLVLVVAMAMVLTASALIAARWLVP